jgi:predicted KAP-like P-loop ATPase
VTSPTADQEPSRDRATAHYEADDPLTEQGLDSFGRWEFSASIGELLATRPEKTSLVVGINAPWGDGKTSVLNFIGGHLRDNHPNVLRIRYTPWLFQGADQVILSFFETLAETVGSIGSGRTGKRVAKKLRDIGISIGESVDIGGFGLSLSPSKLIKGLSEKSISETKDNVAKLLEKEPPACPGEWLVAVVGSTSDVNEER